MIAEQHPDLVGNDYIHDLVYNLSRKNPSLFKKIHRNPQQSVFKDGISFKGGAGKVLVETVGYSDDDGGGFNQNVYQTIPQQQQQQALKIEYRDNPEQANQIAELQKQLKILQDVPKYEPYDFSKERAEYEQRISGLNERIGNIQSGYKTTLADLTAKMQAEREAAEKQLGMSFQSQLSEQQKAFNERFTGQQSDFTSRLTSQRQSAEEQLARQQTLSAKTLNELKGMYQSQLGTAALERQTLEQSLKQQQQASVANQLKFQEALSSQQQTSAANQLKFQEALSAQQKTAAADRLKFSETLASQQSASQKEFEALRGTMSQQRQQYEAGLAAERAANEQARQEQAMSFQRSLASQRGAPQVEGIRYATRGPAAQKGMRGISGTFGRKGGRLMKISALNV